MRKYHRNRETNKNMCKGAEVGVEPDPLEKRRVGKQLKQYK